MSIKKGSVYLIPNTLGGESTSDILPHHVSEIVAKLRYFAVEDLKSARRLLRKLDRSFPIDESTFFMLNKRSSKDDLMAMLLQVIQGNDLGIISEAGCPGIADPGADLVALCHTQGIHLHPLVGPSSFLLALMASGFSGQSFQFHGYLPKERKDRIRGMKTMEMETRRTGITHLFMDTPFRNMNVLEDLLNELADTTELCIAANLTLPQQRIQTMTVVDWREHAWDISKVPVVFLIGKSQGL
ncbi:MAG: SAM-dependent methyltransferase [Flavobacteriia bacterium]|jgi:16S rRNA (cytidine1402-2'-O)-methyltransferase|nr:SAM-dependent methyltransferase [Flavobacteriia bacterium]